MASVDLSVEEMTILVQVLDQSAIPGRETRKKVSSLEEKLVLSLQAANKVANGEKVC